MIKKIFSFLIFLFLCSNLSAETLVVDEEMQKLSNEVMQLIYDDIFAVKEKYEELDAFNESHMHENEYGINEIVYEKEMFDDLNQSRKFTFALTIDPINAKRRYSSKDRPFQYEFLLLDLKIVAYYKNKMRSSQFNLNEVIQNNALLLSDAQSKKLPFEFSLVPVKAEYKVGEVIKFDVILHNPSKNSLRVKALSKKTLSFLFNTDQWEDEAIAHKSEYKRTVIIKPKESLTKKFSAPAVFSPNEFNILCTYALKYKGVYPTARLKVDVTR